MTSARWSPAATVLASLSLALAACAAPGPSAAPPAIAGNPPAPAKPGAPDAAAPVASPPGAAPAPPRRAGLRFEIDDRPFPSPLVDAVVGGQPTTLLVDTGATHHVVAAWLAAEIAAPVTTAGDVGVDHAGKRVQVSRLEGTGLSLSGWGPVDAPGLLVIPVPDALRRAGIGGVLSPQSLAAGGRAIVLDLRAGAMTEAPLDEALRRLAAVQGAALPVELGACAEPRSGRELTAPATIDGIPVTLKVDTGATQSSLFVATAVRKRLAAGASKTRSAYAASGKHAVAVREGATLALGSFTTSIDIDIIPSAPRQGCPTDGFVGMDVLRGCVLVLAEGRSLAACAAP